MSLVESAQVAGAAILLIAGLASVLVENGRRRWIVDTLYFETRGLRREAIDLAEAICERRSRELEFDDAFIQRYTLSEPQTYRGLARDLWRVPSCLSLVDFHGHLSVARARWAIWRDGDRGPVSTYLLLSALVRSTNVVEPLEQNVARYRRWSTRRLLHAPQANAFIEKVEAESPEYLDFAYWSE